MRLFGAMEYLVLTVELDRTLRGVRFRRGKQLRIDRMTSVSDDGSALPVRLEALGRELGIRRRPMLALSVAFPGSVVFACTMPELPPRDLESALQLEVPQQVMRLPDQWVMQYVAQPGAVAGTLNVRVEVIPQEELQALVDALRVWKCKPDLFLSPWLALPELPPGSRIAFPGVTAGFFWADGGFHPMAGEVPKSPELDLFLASEFVLPESESIAYRREYAAALVVGRMLADPRLRQRSRSLQVLPVSLRPQRLRSQLRLTVLLAVLLLLLAAWRGMTRVIAFHSQYSAVAGQTAAAKKRSSELQSKLRTKEKELKEMNRVVELGRGERRLANLVAMLSQVLPGSVLVSNLRLNDTGVELTLQSTAENLDLAGALRRVPGYKLATLQDRKINDTLTMYTVKMTRVQEGGNERKK